MTGNNVNLFIESYQEGGAVAEYEKTNCPVTLMMAPLFCWKSHPTSDWSFWPKAEIGFSEAIVSRVR